MPPAKTVKSPSPAELIDLITKQAPALIKAGITSLSIDGFAVTLAPPAPQEPDGEVPKAAASPPPHINPLKDPSTYPGGRVPGFTREGDG